MSGCEVWHIGFHFRGTMWDHISWSLGWHIWNVVSKRPWECSPLYQCLVENCAKILKLVGCRPMYSEQFCCEHMNLLCPHFLTWGICRPLWFTLLANHPWSIRVSKIEPPKHARIIWWVITLYCYAHLYTGTYIPVPQYRLSHFCGRDLFNFYSNLC